MIALIGVKVFTVQAVEPIVSHALLGCDHDDQLGRHIPVMVEPGTTMILQNDTLNVGTLPISHLSGITDLSGSGLSTTKIRIGTFTPTTGNGYSIDISGGGFSNIWGYSIIPIKNTATPNSVPLVSIKSVSTSAIVVNLVEGQAGLGLVFADVTGVTLKVVVYGN